MNSTDPQVFGISAAIATPFAADGSIDIEKLSDHSKRLLSEGCASLTYFGTTGEGPSLSITERHDVLQAMRQAGVPGHKMNPAIINAALGDALAEAKHATEIGANALLVAPPFYFKQPDDAGLFQWFSEFLGALPAGAPKVVLYHIPQVTAAPLSPELVSRLKQAFPDLVYGVKDSSGVWENGRDLLKIPGLAVMLGDERLLDKAVALGAKGMISGVANFRVQRLNRIFGTGQSDPDLVAMVDAIVSLPVIPAVKSALARHLNDDAWRQVRAPLRPLSDEAHQKIAGGIDVLPQEFVPS